MEQTAFDRIQELVAKKDSLKSKRLGKKETEELRTLASENARLFMIFSWDKGETNDFKKLLEDNNIKFSMFLMPETFHLNNF